MPIGRSPAKVVYLTPVSCHKRFRTAQGDVLWVLVSRTSALIFSSRLAEEASLLAF